MKKNQLFAPFLMLFAGAISSIAMFCFGYSMKEMLPVLLAVLVVFYLVGCFIQKMVLSFMDQIRKREAEALERENAAGEELAAEENGESVKEEMA